MTVDNYKAIARIIFNEIEDTGYMHKSKASAGDQKTHGLDVGKLHAAALFYLPCRSKDPSGRYFKIFKSKSRDVLNVDEWIERAKPQDEFDSEPFLPASELNHASYERVQAAIQRWHAESQIPGNGNAAFYRLACSLAGAGCDAFEIGEILKQEVVHARYAEERRKDISRIVNDLIRRGYIRTSDAAE